MLALGLELVGRPVRSPKQLEQLGLPVIGIVPLIKSKASQLKPRPSTPRPKRFAGFLWRRTRYAA
jgi:hypothetical protein